MIDNDSQFLSILFLYIILIWKIFLYMKILARKFEKSNDKNRMHYLIILIFFNWIFSFNFSIKLSCNFSGYVSQSEKCRELGNLLKINFLKWAEVCKSHNEVENSNRFGYRFSREEKARKAEKSLCQRVRKNVPSFGPPLVQPIIRLIRHSRQLVAKKATSRLESRSRSFGFLLSSIRFFHTHARDDRARIILRATLVPGKDPVVVCASCQQAHKLFNKTAHQYYKLILIRKILFLQLLNSVACY